MQLHRTVRVLTSWLAVLAILMAGLAPSILHALGSRIGSSEVEICTSVGAKWVYVGGNASDETPAPSGTHSFDHCPYCSLHANAIAIPASPAATLPAPPLAHDLPIAFLAAPRTLAAWVSAQPRAPPLLS
jgi:hypothetical protein